MDPACASTCCSGLSADGVEAGFVTDDDDEHDNDDDDDDDDDDGLAQIATPLTTSPFVMAMRLTCFTPGCSCGCDATPSQRSEIR